MLHIRRREGEKLKIGEEIVIEVGSCTSGSVKLAIEAPLDLRITRIEPPAQDADTQSRES